MKQLATILFLSIYLLATTQISELFKLPALINHYQLHSQWDRNPSFFGFLAEHYSQDNQKNADYDEDMKLPFKTVSHCDHCFTSFYPMVPTVKLVKKVKFSKPRQRPDYTTPLYTSQYLNNIWQPPKNC